MATLQQDRLHRGNKSAVRLPSWRRPAHVAANGWFYETFNTVSGSTYTVTAKIRVNSVGAGGRIQPLVLDQASGSVLASGTNLTAVTAGYQTQTFSFVATGSQSALHFQTFNSSIDADVDDVTVMGQGTAATSTPTPTPTPSGR